MLWQLEAALYAAAFTTCSCTVEAHTHRQTRLDHDEYYEDYG